jgi:hypothetical protein
MLFKDDFEFQVQFSLSQYPYMVYRVATPQGSA